MRIRLNFLDALNISDLPEGLTEPSGLCLPKGGKGLWTVSDDTRMVFRLDPDGRIMEGESFAVDQVGFEGISLDETGDYLYTVQEEGNVLLKYSLATKNLVTRQRLSQLIGYEKVRKYFSDGLKNKGLEGITVNTETGNLFLLKEGGPGLLLEVTPDLRTLVESRKLTKKRGFTDKKAKQKKIDYSGISYDYRRQAFWIVSDKARRIYLYSWDKDKVLGTKALKYTKSKKRKKTIAKAEGVAYDADNDRLYIVSDETTRLYRYDLDPMRS